MKTKLAILASAIVAVIIIGCTTTPPSKLESYLFDTTTNLAPVIVTVTNASGVTVQEERIIATVTQTPSAALKSWAGLASAVMDTVSPGSGSLLGIGLLGGAGFFAVNRQRKLTDAINVSNDFETESINYMRLSENFAQGIEVLREVLKTTPQGQVLDTKIVDMLHRNQVSVGLIKEAASIVSSTVDNDAAKRAAHKLLSLLQPEAKTTPS